MALEFDDNMITSNVAFCAPELKTIETVTTGVILSIGDEELSSVRHDAPLCLMRKDTPPFVAILTETVLRT